MTTMDKKHDVSFDASGLLDACSLLRHQVANLISGVFCGQDVLLDEEIRRNLMQKFFSHLFIHIKRP